MVRLFAGNYRSRYEPAGITVPSVGGPKHSWFTWLGDRVRSGNMLAVFSHLRHSARSGLAL